MRDVPFNLDHPYWVDDPGFDIDFHVRHTAVAPPGSDEQLGELVARIVGRPLDRTRPLWESYVIEGLPDDRFGILTKVHHATIDGAAGAELLVLMLDGDPEGDDIAPAVDDWRPERLPSDSEVLTRAASNLMRKPARAVVLATRTVRELGRTTRSPVVVAAANQVRDGLRGPLGAVLNLGRERSPEGETLGPLPTGAAPRTPFNAAITAHRRFAFRSTSLELVKDVKNALGATVNDVVMAACAGGLRTWLEAHDALPDVPLVAMVPVSIRTGEETEKWTNRVSSIFAALPTDEPDPLKRVERVHEAMVGAKELFDAVPADALTDFAQFPPPAVFAARDAHRHPAQHEVRAAGERRDLERARSPRAALHRGRASCCTTTPCPRSLTARASTSPCRATSTRSTSGSSPAGSSCLTCGTWSTPSSPTSRSWRSWPASSGADLLDDLQEDALAGALLGGFDRGVDVGLRNGRRAFGHLVDGVGARPVEDVRPAGLLDVGEPVVVHGEDAGLELHADPVAGAQILVDPNLERAHRSAFYLWSSGDRTATGFQF